VALSVGFVEHPVITRGWPTAAVRSGYLRAALAGVDTYWMPDHLNSLVPRSIAVPKYVGLARVVPDVDAVCEPWTLLGQVAGWNRIGRLRLGVAVTDGGRRNPAVTAQAAATLHLMSRGKAILGIGVGEREGNEPYGVDWSRPVARFEEALATIRVLWDSGGELVSRDSEYFPLHKALFALPPYRGAYPPIWVAAHGPRMLHIAGRFADGWFPAIVLRPRDYAQRLDVVRSAASDAGRDPSAILPAISLTVFTGRTRDAVDEAMSSVAAMSMALCLPGADWARHGGKHPLGEDFSGAQDLIPQTLDEQSVLSYTAQVPPSLVREVTLNGTPEEIVDQVAVWRDHGVRHVALTNLSGLQPSLQKALASNGSFTGLMRRLKKL